MITTSLNTQGALGMVASGYEVGPSLMAFTLRSPSGLSGGCNGSGRTCKPNCKPGMGGRRMSIAVKAGCGCSGLSGLSAVSCYDDGSCFNPETSEWTYPGAEQAWNAGVTMENVGNRTTVDYTDYFRNILLPKTNTYQAGNVPVQPTPRPAAKLSGDGDVPWPLFALLGVGLLAVVAS